MSIRVQIIGWRPGLRKVSMTDILRTETQMGLGEAKRQTDRILEGETVTFFMESKDRARDITHKLQLIGAIVHVPELQNELLSSDFIHWLEQELLTVLQTPIEDEQRLRKTREFITAFLERSENIPAQEHTHIFELLCAWETQGYIHGKHIRNEKSTTDWLEGIIGTVEGIIESKHEQ